MWVARDQDTSIWLFTEKPVRRSDNVWDFSEFGSIISPRLSSCEIFHEMFPFLTWDNEPIEVEFIKMPGLWVARDECKSLFMYTHKPVKTDYNGVWEFTDGTSCEICGWMFPEVRWETDPIQVSLIRKRKIQKKRCGWPET